MGEGAPPEQNNPLAKATALRALELDSTLGMPYVTLGWIRLITDLDFDGHDRDFRRALELSPGSSQIHAWYADYLKLAGRFDEALREYRLAVDLNPLDASLGLGLGDFYFFAHHSDEAIAQLRRTLAQEPGYYPALELLSLAYSQKGMHEAALALCDSAMAVTPHEYPNGSCGSVYARAGRRQQALEMIQQMTVPSHRGGPDFLGACFVYAALGDGDRAMEWLRRAVRGRSQSQYLVLLKVYPMFDPLRGDPRFQALLRELRIQS
jgi:serine/threonine-protein kinase